MSESDHVGLVFLLVYACGALVELLIRLSLGVPAWARPTFAKNRVLAALQPVVFVLVPALLWPLVALHHLFRPVCDWVVARCCGRRRARDEEEDAAATTTTHEGGGGGGGGSAIPFPASSARTSMASSSSSSTCTTMHDHDLEKQEVQVEKTAPVPSSAASQTRTTPA